jgi:hypothetical protein
MKVARYELKEDKSKMVYEFFSDGPKGKISKLIIYDELPKPYVNVYNLGFGDTESMLSGFNDKSRSNNGDTNKILATVASTVYTFLTKYPDYSVYAKGSTESRTRLYQMGIAANLDEISKDFEVAALRNGIWEEFRKGIKYEAFLVKRKKN